jgi:hypothetical protein
MHMTGPVKVFATDGKWVVDYGSYAHGYHPTRVEAMERRYADQPPGGVFTWKNAW